MSKQRCHISIVLEESMKIVVALFVLIFAQLKKLIILFLDFRHGSLGKILLGLGILLLILFLITLRNYLVWRKTYIWIQDQSIIVERNTWFHKKNVYNMQFISNIDLEQNLFERWIGTNRIKIDTNSSVTASKTDIKILFSTEEARKFKQLILAEKNSESIIEHTQSDRLYADVTPKCKEDLNGQMKEKISFSGREIVRHVLVGVHPFTYIVIITYIIAIIMLLGNGFGNAGLNHFWIRIVGGMAATLLAIGKVVYEKIKDALLLYRFQIYRQKDKLYLEYGFFNHITKTIPVDKINAVIIKEPFLARLFRLYQVQIVNVGTGDEKNENRFILLSLPKNRVLEYMKELLPEYESFFTQKMTFQSTKYYFHYLYNLIIPTIFAFFAMYYMFLVRGMFQPYFFPIAGGMFLLFVLGTMFLRFHTHAYHIESKYILVSNGILAKSTTAVLYSKIQKIGITSKIPSFFTSLVSIECYIIGESGKRQVSLPLMRREVADQLVNYIKETDSNI